MNFLVVNKDLENYFFTLFKLAVMGARQRQIKTSTQIIAEKLGISQQTVSRRLIELEKKGLIQRVPTREGSLIRISHSGDILLREVYTVLNSIFKMVHPLSLTIEGTVFSGFGEGSYYVTRDIYREQFIDKLGFDPFPGTLNLRVNSEYNLGMINELEIQHGIVIKGFKNKDRTYGSVKCFRATLNHRENGAIVLALRTHYDRSVIEVISPVCLRSHLKLKDGDKVRVEVFLGVS